ncbi:MAG: aldo/keto reductase [Spirochaetota bacterium]
MKQIRLRDGRTIPQLGLGTWQLTGRECRKSVAEAIAMGYRHIDTAFAYGNHNEVAAGIKESGLPREELYVTTKIPLNEQSRSQVLALGQSIPKQLGMEYVDLLLLHWPDKTVPFEETFAALAALIEEGRTRSIGISNFNPDLVRRADAVSPVPVVTNQVEFHPYLYQKTLLETCEELDIRVTAYSPIARGEVVGDDRLEQIGRAHDASAVQVSLAWLFARGLIVIPKASSEDHLRSNLAATEIELTPDELERIDSFEEHRRFVDGSWKHFPLE